MRWNPALPAVVVAFLLAALPAQAQDEPAEDPNTPTFAVVVDEPTETPPPAADFYDILEVAVSEPGDGTFVLRGTLAGAPADPSVGRLFFGFTTGAGDILGGCTFGGAPNTRNIGEPIPPDSCAISGNVVYATYSYEAAETAPGNSLTQTWAFTDMCAPAGCLPGDTAPGGDGSVGPNGWNVGVYGLDYLLTGCTRPLGCGGSASEPALEQLNGTTVNVGRSATNLTTATDLYAWSTNLTAAQVMVNATVGNGSAVISVRDGANATILNETLNVTGEFVLYLSAAVPGNWSIQVDYVNFTGNLTLSIGPLPPFEEPTTTSTSTSEAERTGTFPLIEDKDTPGLGFVAPVLMVTMALAFAVRRRLD